MRTRTATTTVETATNHLPEVVLGKTTYKVEEWVHTFVDHLRGDVTVTDTMTVLTGPRGAQYFLRGFLGEDTGRRQVISFTSGAPLRVKGNEVRVVHLGGHIEVA